MTVHPYGKGMSVHIAARVEDECLLDIYADIFKERRMGMGILPMGLEIHTRVNEEKRYRFYLNFSEGKVTIPPVHARCRDMATGEEIPAGAARELDRYGFLVTEEER